MFGGSAGKLYGPPCLEGRGPVLFSRAHTTLARIITSSPAEKEIISSSWTIYASRDSFKTIESGEYPMSPDLSNSFVYYEIGIQRFNNHMCTNKERFPDKRPYLSIISTAALFFLEKL